MFCVVMVMVNMWCCQQGHIGSKTLHQQNLNWRCWLTHVDLCNGCEMGGSVGFMWSSIMQVDLVFRFYSSSSKHFLFLDNEISVLT